MGCNDSLPVNTIPPPPPLKVPRRQTDRRILRKESNLVKEQIALNDYFEILNVIGSTNTGVLLKAKDLRSGTMRTINEISKTTDIEYADILKEVGILNTLDHPNVLKCYNVFESLKSIYLILENIEGGHIQSKIKTSSDEILVAKYMQEVFSALNYMHQKGVIHCNLHIGNILLSNDSYDAVPKIVGFRNSQWTRDKNLDIKLLNYESLSPEILENLEFDEKTDVWSAGIISYQLLIKKLPFSSKKKKEVLESILKGDLDFENPTFKTLSFNAQDFLKKVLKRDKFERISAFEALSHPFLSNVAKDTAVSYEVIQRMRRFKIKTNVVKSILNYMNFKLDFNEHTIITLFKKMDLDFNGNISKEEMLHTFRTIGIDADHEMDCIMENLDIDRSGNIDFSELKIVLVDWDKQIRKKVLGKVFGAENNFIEFESFRFELSDILQSEWLDFNVKVQLEHGKIALAKLKEYIKLNLVY